MIPTEYEPLVERLITITDSNNKKWETTSDDNKFTLDIGKKSVAIYQYQAYPSEETTVALEILDTFGSRIDGIYISQSDLDFDKMWDLFSAAKRSALKIYQTIAELLKGLE